MNNSTPYGDNNMKHFIITLLSALTLAVSGLALAGAPPVEAPVVQENPAVQQSPVQQEVVETEKCDCRVFYRKW